MYIHAYINLHPRYPHTHKYIPTTSYIHMCVYVYMYVCTLVYVYVSCVYVNVYACLYQYTPQAPSYT